MSEKRKVEDILAELGKKIDRLVEETKQAGSKVSEELKAQKEKIEEQIRNRSSNGNEKWAQAREHLNDAAEALHKAFGSLFK